MPAGRQGQQLGPDRRWWRHAHGQPQPDRHQHAGKGEHGRGTAPAIQGTAQYATEEQAKGLRRVVDANGCSFGCRWGNFGNQRRQGGFQDIEGNEAEVKRLLDDALALANKFLKVEIPFGCDTQFGYKYSQIH